MTLDDNLRRALLRYLFDSPGETALIAVGTAAHRAYEALIRESLVQCAGYQCVDGIDCLAYQLDARGFAQLDLARPLAPADVLPPPADDAAWDGWRGVIAPGWDSEIEPTQADGEAK